MKRGLTIATCQFPVSGNVQKNLSFVLAQAARAAEGGADVAHFSESSLSGYGGIDFENVGDVDEDRLQSALAEVRKLASDRGIWVIVGGHQSGPHGPLPYNCLWVVDDSGAAVARYDKRFCMGEPGTLEHRFYTPGRFPIQFKIGDITCGLLICHEWRYPELYREQAKLGTEVLFQSWYDGSLGREEYAAGGGNHGSLIVGTVRGNAANNYLWVSASNTSGRESSFASFVARPDGGVPVRLKRNVAGVLITKIDLEEEFEDLSGPWRERASSGVLHTDTSEARGE